MKMVIRRAKQQTRTDVEISVPRQTYYEVDEKENKQVKNIELNETVLHKR